MTIGQFVPGREKDTLFVCYNDSGSLAVYAAPRHVLDNVLYEYEHYEAHELALYVSQKCKLVWSNIAKVVEMLDEECGLGAIDEINMDDFCTEWTKRMQTGQIWKPIEWQPTSELVTTEAFLGRGYYVHEAETKEALKATQEVVK